MKTQKHRLLIYKLLSKRFRGILLLLFIVMLAIGFYDQFSYDPETNAGFLGDWWFIWWVVVLVVFLLWFYYAFLMPKAFVKAKEKILRLQGPIFGVNISYARVYAITLAQMEQHFSWNELKGNEQKFLKPLYNRTCIFIELTSWPKRLQSESQRKLFFPEYIFGTSRPGVICVVEDWKGLSQDLEVGRVDRQTQRKEAAQDDTRSLARQILDLDDDDF